MTTRPSTQARRTLDGEQLADLLRPLTDSAQLWRSLAQFGADGRWWQRLHHSDQVDIWLLTWLTGHRTKLHDHGGSAGAFSVVTGALTEVRVTPDRADLSQTVVPPGGSVAVDAATVHDVYNPDPVPAISLHAYSPPLSQMTFYSLDHGRLATVRTAEVVEGSVEAA